MGWVLGLFGLLIIVNLILWFFLPFAVFGTKEKLDALRDQLNDTNAHLAVIARLLTDERRNAPPAKPPATTDDGGRIEPR